MAGAPIEAAIGAVDATLGIAEDIGSFLAAPTPPGPAAAAIQAAGQRACRSWGNVPPWFRATQAISSITMDLACGPYLSDNGWEPPEPGLGVPGGQCPTLYEVTWETTFEGPDDDDEPTVVQGGPETKVGPISLDGGTLPNGAPFVQLVDGNGSGFGRATTSASAPRSISIEPSFQRLDGEPDDCGDSLPLEPAPNPPPNDAPYPPGDPNTPTVGPDGGIRIPVPPLPNPFGPNLPDIQLPDIQIPAPGSDEGGDPPGQDGEPTPPQPGGGGGGEADTPPDEELPEGREWFAVLVRLTEVPQNFGEIVGSDPWRIFPRTVGNVRPLFRVGGQSTQGTAQDIRSVCTLLTIPADSVTFEGVNVNLLPGATYTATWYYRDRR